MISLDDIRRELRISPTANQAGVVREAKQRAKELLSKKVSFVWNKLKKMLSILEPPSPWEARTVEWITRENAQ